LKIAQLIEAAAQGDTEARDRLFELYMPYLKRIATSEFGYRTAEARFNDSDIMQDTYLRATKAWSQFSGRTEPEFTQWMRTILKHRIQEIYRENTAQCRDQRREARANINASDSAQVHWLQPVDTGPSPGSRLIQGENALLLLAALEKLPTHQRQAVELRYLEHRKIREIAEVMDRSVGSVAGIIRNGLAALEAELPDRLNSS